MKRNFLMAGTLAVSLLATNAGAQSINPQCAPGDTQDVCQKAIDVFRYVGAQLGTVIAGGNATLGQGGTLGGFPRFKVGLRVNAMSTSLPKVEDYMISTTGAEVTHYATKSQIVPLPQIDAAVGLFKGIPLGITNVGGVDLLLSLAYLPTIEDDEFSIKGSTKVGVGARIGLLQEGIAFPGVSLTYIRRDLPATADMRTSVGSDSVAVEGVTVKTNSWRLVASKNLMMFGLAAGYGKDQYTSDATFMGYVSSTNSTLPPTSAKHKVNRNNIFLDLSMNLPFVKIVGEIGQVSGGKIDTYNTFDKSPTSSRIYGSIGFRAGL